MFQSAIDGDCKFIPATAHRETSVRVSRASRGEFNIAHSEVKGASQVMDGIPDSEKHLVWGGLIRADLKDAISSLRIILDQNTVRVSLGEFSRLQVKFVDVLIGPLDL